MRKRGKSCLIISLIVIFIIVLVIFFIWYQHNNAISMNKSTICFDNMNKTCFDIEIAKTDMEKTKGLMFREELGEKEGMFFVYNNEGDRGFWMKNTLIPLDLIGLDKNLSIVFIKENFLPCKIERCEVVSIKNSMYVLEVNSGISEKYNFSIGEKAEINF